MSWAVLVGVIAVFLIVAAFWFGYALGDKENREASWHDGYKKGAYADGDAILDVIKFVDSPEYAGNISGEFAKGWRSSLHEMAEIVKMGLEKENYIG